jgi:hypothetical protein
LDGDIASISSLAHLLEVVWHGWLDHQLDYFDLKVSKRMRYFENN